MPATLMHKMWLRYNFIHGKLCAVYLNCQAIANVDIAAAAFQTLHREGAAFRPV